MKRKSLTAVMAAVSLLASLADPAVIHAQNSGGQQEMYRAYNPNSGEHFYTSSKSEFNHIVSLGWRDEGIGWTAPVKSSTPVYRLYNKYGGEHHYTTKVKERDMLVKAGWRDEGIGWYSDDDKTVPLLREYNPNKFSCNHNYTTNRSEHAYLIRLGWKDEGIAWYGLSAGKQNGTGKNTAEQNAQKALDNAKADKQKADAALASASLEQKKAEAAVSQADQNLQNAQNEKAAKDQAVTSAQKEVADTQHLQNVDKDGSLGYFQQKGAANAAAILEEASRNVHNGRNHPGVESGLTHIGEADDATSLENMKKALELIRHGNELRTSDDHFRNLPAWKVSDTMMAYAQAASNMESQFVDHWVALDGVYRSAFQGYSFGENASWGLSNDAGEWDHYAGWYTEEKKYYENGNTGDAGHYLNIVDSNDVTGLGCNTRPGVGYGTTATQDFGDYASDAVDFDAYYADFMAYYNKIQAMKQPYLDAQAALKQVENEQRVAVDKVSAAQSALQKASTEKTSADQKVQTLTQQAAQAQKAVNERQQELNRLRKR